MTATPLCGAPLSQLIRIHLDTMMRSRGSNDSDVEHIVGFISEFRHHWQALNPSSSQALLVEHALRQAELKLAAHAMNQTGTDPSGAVELYRAFVKGNAGVLYDSLLDWIASMIEDDLFLSQYIHFNTMDFGTVARFLDRDMKIYRNILSTIKDYDTEDLHTHDKHLAKLTGTLGQAHGFLACAQAGIGSAVQHYEEASILLLEDIGMLHKGTDDWIQGVNYLVALEWRHGSFDKALRWFSESLRCDAPLTPDRLLHIDDNAALVSKTDAQYLWIVLNQVRLCALGVKQGIIQAPKEGAMAMLRQYEKTRRSAYPDHLIIKWLLVLAGRDSCGLNGILNSIVDIRTTVQHTPILELMRAVELSLCSALCPNQGKQRAWCQSAGEILNQHCGFGRFGDFLGTNPWAMAVLDGTIHKMDLYDIAVALPFYYA